MAEKEKRRSTTFVTSRGAIINVAAPSVYIAPGVTPVDVTSPAELREELDIHSAITQEKLMREGVDSHFNLWNPPADKKVSDYWNTSGVRSTPSFSAAIYSKKAYNYPCACFQMKLPSLVGYPAGTIIYWGFENGGRGLGGSAMFMWSTPNGVSEVLNCGVSRGNYPAISTDITNLVVNPKTSTYRYYIELTKSMAVFYLWNRPVCYALMTPLALPLTDIAGPPYKLTSGDYLIPRSQLMLIEPLLAAGATADLVLPVSPYDVRVAESDPCPPRVIPLYAVGTNTLWAGMAVVNGVTVTSHPFPLYGFAGKTVDFQATVAGTLFIDVLTQTNNWRVYPPNAGTAITAGVLENFPISGDEVIGRLRFTPAANGTISDAEVHLR